MSTTLFTPQQQCRFALEHVLGTFDKTHANAGKTVFQMIDDLTADAFHQQFDLNVLGYLLAVREALELFGKSGSIINISSILSIDPYLAPSVYAATKGAVDTLIFALARELGPRGIRVNSILRGHTNTPATDGNFAGELGAKIIAGAPLGIRRAGRHRTGCGALGVRRFALGHSRIHQGLWWRARSRVLVTG